MRTFSAVRLGVSVDVFPFPDHIPHHSLILFARATSATVPSGFYRVPLGRISDFLASCSSLALGGAPRRPEALHKRLSLGRARLSSLNLSVPQ